MQESIKIENLGPIKHIELDTIKPFMVLIGPSGSGKSTLMKVLALFRWIFKKQNIRSYLKHSNISKSPFRLVVKTLISNSGFEEYLTSNTFICYSISFRSGLKYSIILKDGKLSYPQGETIPKDDLEFNKVSFISETRNIIPLWHSRGAALTGAYLGFYFHEVFKDFDKATDNLKNDLNLNHLGAIFQIKKSQSLKKYTMKSIDSLYQDLELKHSSSGAQSSVPISIITNYFSKSFNFNESFNGSVLDDLLKNDKLTDFQPVKNLGTISKKIFIHIEEPELSLYPDAQCVLIEQVVDDCFRKNSNNINLIISTHSPYLVNYLNLLIRKFDSTKGGEGFDCNKLEVLSIADGKANSLMAVNERVVNATQLSDTINNIYDAYENLKD